MLIKILGVSIGAKERMLELLKKNVGCLVTREELSRVAGVHEWARQIRYLRQEGWKIEVIRGERGGYRLTSPEKGHGRPREAIDDKTRAMVLYRDRSACRMCGRTPEDGVKLHVNHKLPVDWGGSNELDNLETLCDECNQGKKAFFSTLDADTMRRVQSLESGRERLLEFIKSCKGKEVGPYIFSVVSRIRDWMRELRKLRQDGLIDYTYDRKKEVYCITKVPE